MLSILIPVYNYDVRALVGALTKQCIGAKIRFEILCWDDRSNEDYHLINQQVTQLQGVAYFRLAENVGRSKIRNLLAKSAKYDQLLFLDCDSGLLRDDYIEKYLAATAAAPVVCGGRNYEQSPPSDLRYYFHWKYGSRREVRSASERSEAPHAGFMSNNFMVKKSVLLATPFDETLVQYGHEDTLWGEELATKGMAILHIDNPIVHLGLDPVDQFIGKTKEALENLVKLQKDGKPVSIRLNKIAQWGKKIGLPRLANSLGSQMLSKMESNFSSRYPSLRLFDLYRLIYLSKIQ